MFALRPLHGGDHHHQRVQLLRALSEATPVAYRRYADDGEQKSYIIEHPGIGELPLGQRDAELYVAGFCAGLLATAADFEDIVVGMLPRAASSAENAAYYLHTDTARPPAGPVKVGMRLVKISSPGVGVILMRRDYATTFLAAFLAARAYPDLPFDRIAVYELVQTLLADAPTL